LFDPTTGLGMTILRVGMSSIGGFVNGNEANSIAAAKKYGATKIIGSVWSPPAGCKTNNSTVKGGHLLASCYGSWSDAIANFAKNNGLYAMSLGSEPDFASCGTAEPCNGDYDTTLYTANEMVAFVKVAGPKLHAAGVKVIAPETAEWNHLWSNTSACCSEPSGLNSSDPLKCGCFGTSTACSAACAAGGGYDYGHYLHADTAAWAAFDIVGTHQYDSQVATPWPSNVPARKPVWMTEMAGFKWWPELTPWVTSAGANLTSQAAIAVTGGIFTAALASKSVTTFVGK
jgi:O-glycosyl hydrolase